MKFLKRTLLVLCVLVSANSAQAGGPLILNTSGVPYTWDSATAIPYHPETGSCGGFTNAEMRAKITLDLNQWSDLTDVDVGFTESALINADVNGDNYLDYYFDSTDDNTDGNDADGVNPIIFDDDGVITGLIGGTGNIFYILGLANPTGFSADEDDAEILEGQSVLNCRCMSGNPNGACTDSLGTHVTSVAENNFTVVHEFGHFLNLDHTIVNDDLVDDDFNCISDCTDLPTMYPYSVDATEQQIPQRDDIVALARLYPSTTFEASVCTVTGTILDENGDDLRCADVEAVTSDPADTVALMSGAYASATDNSSPPDGDTQDSGECDSDCGDFSLKLEPGKSYTLNIRVNNRDEFVVGSGISPCSGELTTAVENEDNIATVSTACTAGATVALGDITTSSPGGDSGGGSTSDDLHPNPIHCGLNNTDATASGFSFVNWIALIAGLSLILGVRFFSSPGRTR